MRTKRTVLSFRGPCFPLSIQPRHIGGGVGDEIAIAAGEGMLAIDDEFAIDGRRFTFRPLAGLVIVPELNQQVVRHFKFQISLSLGAEARHSRDGNQAEKVVTGT